MDLERFNSSRITTISDLRWKLKIGNITKGKILKLYPNQKAFIQLGSQAIVAQLQASLSVDTSYFFLVQPSPSDVIHLKVLHDEPHCTTPENPQSLLRFLELKSTRGRNSFLDMLIRDEIPFSKPQLMQAFSLLENVPGKENAFSIIKEMIIRKLPLTDAVFQALLSYKQNSFSIEARQMLQAINGEPITKTKEKLHNLLNKLFVNTQGTPKSQFLQQMNDLSMTGIGAGKRGYLADGHDQAQTMKSLLIQLLHNSDGVVHAKTKQFIHFLNGLHLQSLNETENFLEVSIQIPAEKLGLVGDMEVKVFSQKTASGELNPDYCHVILYLELAHLKETRIDMQIQKRKVNLTIFNENYASLKNVEKVSIEALKNGLKELGYELQSAQFQDYLSKEEQKMTKKMNTFPSEHQGVDYRI